MQGILAYIAGWKNLLKSKRILLALYLFNLTIAALAVFPFIKYFEDNVGNSVALGNSINKFDFTFLADFMNNYGSFISIFGNVVLVIILLYFILSTFLNAGIYSTFTQNVSGSNYNGFWQNCLSYFFKFFRLAFYFILIHGFFVFLEWQLFKHICGSFSFFEMENDKCILDAAFTVLPIAAIVHLFTFLVHDFCKAAVASSKSAFITKSIFAGIAKLFKRFFNAFVLYFLLLLTLINCSFIYKIVRKLVEPENSTAILLAFLIGQVYLIVQLAIKLVNAKAIVTLYKEN